MSSSAALLFTLMVSRCWRVTGALQAGEAAPQQAAIKAPLSDTQKQQNTGVCFVSEGWVTLINNGTESTCNNMHLVKKKCLPVFVLLLFLALGCQSWDYFRRMRHTVQELGEGVRICHLRGTPVPPVTFSLGRFSLQALAGDSCTSKGSRQRGREMAAKKKKKGMRRKQWLYLEPRVRGGIDKQSLRCTWRRVWHRLGVV